LRYKIADYIFDIVTLYPFTREMCGDYAYTGDAPTDCRVVTTQQQIDAMKLDYEDKFNEFMLVHSIVSDYLVQKNCIVFHGSCVEHKGIGYIFTAVSGTGKSTHAELWHRELQADWINDDKPILHIAEDGVLTAYGSPWNGKHRRGKNASVVVKNMVILERGEKNYIEEISFAEAFPRLFSQTHKPEGERGAIFALMGKIKVRCFRLTCNMQPEAAWVAFEGMQKDKKIFIEGNDAISLDVINSGFDYCNRPMFLIQ